VQNDISLFLENNMPSNAKKPPPAGNQYLFKEKALITSSNPPQAMAFDRVDYITTEALADTMDLRPQTIRKRLSLTGSYYGLKPVKLPNRRLLWVAAAVSKFLRGEGA
jgi:hypothetical protein